MISLSTAVVTVVNAVLQLVVAFGVTISDTQNAAITAVVNAILLLIAVLYDQRKTPAPKPVTGP